MNFNNSVKFRVKLQLIGHELQCILFINSKFTPSYNLATIARSPQIVNHYHLSYICFMYVSSPGYWDSGHKQQ